MMFRSNAAPKNRRTNSRKKRSQSILDVSIRSDAAARQRNSKIMKWLCVLILIGTVSSGLYLGVQEGLRRFVFENPDYVLSSLEVVTDGSLTREEIMQITGIREGKNIFAINLSRAQTELQKQPRVELAEIIRTLPNRVAITITERKPVAWIAAKNSEDPTTDPKSFLVDRKGTLISNKNLLPEHLHLPIINGISTDNMEAGETVDTYELRAALDLVRITSDSPRIQVCSIDLSKRYCMVVTDRSRAKLTFGMEKIDEQLDRLFIVMDHGEATKQEIQTVNLMMTRNIPVTFAPLGTVHEETPEAKETPAQSKGQKGEKAQGKSDKPQATPAPQGNGSQAKTSSPAKKETPRPTSPSTSSSTKTGKAQPTPPTIKRALPVNQPFNENMPVKKAIPVSSPGSAKHNG